MWWKRQDKIHVLHIYVPKEGVIILEYRSVYQKNQWSFILQKVKNKKMIHVELDFKCRHMDWRKFIWDEVSRNSCQKTKSYSMLFHFQFWCFYFRKQWINRLELLLLCSVYFYPLKKKKNSKIYLRPFCGWSNKQKGWLLTSKEPREEKTYTAHLNPI